MALIAIDFGYWPQEQDRSGGGAGSAACFGQVLGRHQLVRRANRGALFRLENGISSVSGPYLSCRHAPLSPPDGFAGIGC